MRKMRFFILVLLLSAVAGARGQEIVQTHSHTEEEIFLMQKVKLLDEFIARFNYEKKIDGSRITEKNKPELSRKQMITSLIDYNFYVLSPPDSIEAFTDYFIKNNIGISFDTSDWRAEVNTKMKLDNKAVDVLLIMQIETNENGESKWVFKNAEAPFLVSQKNQGGNKFIQPLSHELNFSEFRNVFKNPENITQYASRDYQANQLSAFFRLVESNRLKYEQVNSIQFVFEYPKYTFKISKHTRAEHNSGWLITKIISNYN